MAKYLNKEIFIINMQAQEKIILAYLELKQNKLYFNQLKEYTKLSNSSLQNALDKLLQDNILKLIKTKANTFYQIKNNKIFSLKFSELAYNKFKDLNIGVKVPLRNFIEKLPDNIFTIVLFGSSSRKEEQDGSDIDIMVVADKKINLESLKKEVNIISNYPISIFICSIDQFYKNKDSIIIQARKTGFPIHREQNFYEVLLNEY